MDEVEQLISEFRKAMLTAFRHGREYTPLDLKHDLPEETEDKNLPFNEWFNRYYKGQ